MAGKRIVGAKKEVKGFASLASLVLREPLPAAPQATRRIVGPKNLESPAMMFEREERERIVAFIRERAKAQNPKTTLAFIELAFALEHLAHQRRY